MKLRTICATLALSLGIGFGLSAPASAQAPGPCEVFLCMAGVSGHGASGPECTPSIAAFHLIQVWTPYFNSSATAAARRIYLSSCPGATSVNQGVLEAIISTWGYWP